MLWFTSLTLVFCINAIGGQLRESNRHDYTYVTSTQFSYKYNAKNMCWERAKKQCEQEGATLFYPQSAYELHEVKYLVNQGGSNWMWLGISRKNSEFKTIDDRPLRDVYHDWAEREPNNSNKSENCVVLDQNDELKDYHCNALLPFVCKLPLRTQKRNALLEKFFGIPSKSDNLLDTYYEDNIDDTVFNRYIFDNKINNDVYKYIASTHSMYKYYDKQTSWFNAILQCERERAMLFYPKSEEEASIAIQFSNYTEYSAPWIWVGVFYCEKQHGYKTIDGLPVKLVYANRSPRPPEDWRGCASLQKDGTLFFMKCNKTLSYICKKAF